MNENNLIGLWINKLLSDHFKAEKRNHTEKLFLKITGLNQENIISLLNEFRKSKNILQQSYDPIIRTITPINSFEEFSFFGAETSTWLRNNTRANQALILVINEITPESQSLENIFTIDESYLLSKQGLDSLFNLFSENGILAADEIEILNDFISLFREVSEPQLRSVLQFLVQLINDESPSVIDKIQKNLPSLNLFKDTKLSLSDKGKLKKNYELANLQAGNRNLDTEQLQNKLYSFLEEEERADWAEDIWDSTTSEQFTKEALDFLNNNDNTFLFNEFSLVEKVFSFKVVKNINEQLIDIKQTYTFQDDREEEDFENGYNDVLDGNDPEAIQNFIDDCEDILNVKPGLVKKLTRIVEKLRNPSEYEDLFYGLMREIFLFLEDHSERENIDKLYFRLSINSKLPGNILSIQRLYLNNINKLIPRLDFDIASLLDKYDDSSKELDVSYNLSFHIEDNVIENKKFKIKGLHRLDIYSLYNQVSKKSIPYLQNYAENEIEIIDVQNYVDEKVKYYLAGNQQQMEDHFHKFSNFLINYSELLTIAVDDGISVLNVNSLEAEVTNLLENVYESSQVAKHIYQYVNIIGAIDTFETNKGESSIPNSRVLTIFNPIRLISIIKRYEELSNQIESWITAATSNTLQVEKLDEYLGFIYEKTSNLAPRYFSTNSDRVFLIEQEERLGEGLFTLSNKPHQSTDTLVNELSEELGKTIKNYLEVYPYSKDGLDVLLLYCQSADIVTKCIDEIFKKTKVNKLRLTVHSEHAAKIHGKLNKWIEQKEEYIKPQLGSKFPKLELNVISGKNISSIKESVNNRMEDADIVVLADYFSQANQIQNNFERFTPSTSSSWFETLYKEPLNDDEAVKRISFVSEYLPVALQSFYQLQFIIDTNQMPERNNINVLKNTISISNVGNNALIDFMHERFNWVVILDRYLDKTLLIKTSSQANIIQYKPKTGTNSNFKLIVSSSKYIRKISEETSDYAYYDRLHRKLVSILKNENVSREEVIAAVNKVKDISGALVLKVIGKGKYAHEMLATYLTTKKRGNSESKTLSVWSSCDDLPWFANNKRRPDLVLTTINEEEGKLNIHFELVELKFVSHTIFEKERYDALKQIKSGLSLYEKLFDFTYPKLDTEFWRRELVQYFIEKSSYKPDHIYLLKKLQHINISNITVTMSGSADVYCYTSNLTESNFQSVDEGIYLEKIDSQTDNFIFTRSYILKQLQTTEEVTPEYEELDEGYLLDISTELINDEESGDIVSKEHEVPAEDENFGEVNKLDKEPDKEPDKELAKEPNEEPDKEPINIIPKVISPSFYPEQAALEGVSFTYEDTKEDNEELKNSYIKKLKLKLNQEGIHINVKKSIIGSGVIRLNLELPSGSFKKISNRSEDIQIWLGLSMEPHIFIDKNGINIDVIRDDPETVYFEKFMEIVREQLQNEISGTNLIAPLGLDPLNNVIYMDFSSSMSPHLLTGGTTGSGKSVTLNSIILGMMCLYSNERVEFLFIDPKKVEFMIYENKQHTIDVITEIDGAVGKLNELVAEMENRYTILAEKQVTNLEEYLEEYTEGSTPKLPRIVLVFDEFADFMTRDSETKKEVEIAIQLLSQKGRAAGIHLIICTQTPKADIINTNIRNNLVGRLALKAADANASSIILDEVGAEKLAGKGDFLARVSGTVLRGKSPFLTTKVRRALLNYFSKE
ncbi:FtsK/SpoIIIE domain-containing protein [Peribacillus frigoritolerans]|uniref:FtsK/SpoIIIE domain-containing protein n=1 Tax=Peribacillus frigoritolerans TaxID=450367 RepID=UPI0007BF8A29|nr:FtsK/SpoIIIE domain-containing protein [Peribacillus frigoritolerans]